jgi:hypothetical protein
MFEKGGKDIESRIGKYLRGGIVLDQQIMTKPSRIA